MEKTEQPNHPMPSAGGSYTRNEDGSLTPNPADEAVVAAAEAAAAATNPPAADTPAETSDEPAAEAPARRSTRAPKE